MTINGNKHLISVGHELAATMTADTPIIEIAKLVTRLATALDVQTALVAQLTEQRDALVVENAHVRGRHYFIRALAMSILEHSGGRMDWRSAMNDASELLKTVDGVYAHTPTTDAAIAVLRAEGVEMFAEEISSPYAARDGEHYNDGFNRAIEVTKKKAHQFSHQLRESKGAHG